MDENEYKLQLLQDTITSNAQTIERLADALESLEGYIRAAADDHDCINWYAVNKDEGESARALLAEVRGENEHK